MRGRATGVLILLILLLCVPAVAADDVETQAKKARSLQRKKQHDRALTIWRDLIAKHAKHPVVTDGEAYFEAAKCLRVDAKHVEAAGLFATYMKSHPKGKGVFSAHVGAFRAYDEAKDAAKAQKAGTRLFKRYPEAKGTFAVLVTWLERGWKLPKLATSYDVLNHWTFTRVDGARYPDRRLAFLDVMAKLFKTSKLVKGGTILYCRAWAHMHAGRHAEAIDLGMKFLRGHPKDDFADPTRIVVAKSHLAASPPDLESATKLLEAVANNEDSKQRAAAKDLLMKVGTGPPPIQITEGYPTADGLGKVVMLTNLSKGHALRKALSTWQEARKAEVVTFKGRDVKRAAKALRKQGAEFVAIVVETTVVDNDFQLSMLELCRDLDDDPMPDFHFGYMLARDATDLEALAARILAKDQVGGTAAKDVGTPRSLAQLRPWDFFLHYGHGTARGVVKGLSASQVAELALPKHPVIVSGACFNGVCARTFERSMYHDIFGAPQELKTTDVLSLAWIHAGATALLAALDGDRGEMAGAEWEHFRAHAPALGAVIGHQYRLVFTSLREAYETFPRYVPGRAKNKSFYSVMLRGQASRILLGDPSYKPLKKPLTKPIQETSAKLDAETGAVTIEVEVLRRALGPFVNTLPTKSGVPFKEVRVYARVPLPRELTGKLAFPKVDVSGRKITKTQAKHEVWGGRRYVNLQVESGDFRLAAPGSKITYTFQPAK